MPQFLREIVAQMTMEARASNEINQASGVSVRVTINNYETLVSNAEKRAYGRRARDRAAPQRPAGGRRVDRRQGSSSSTAARRRARAISIERLINRAVLKIWDKYLTLEGCERVVQHFESGWGVEVSDRMRSDEYQEGLRQIPGLRDAVARLVGPRREPGPARGRDRARARGPHLHQKLNRDRDGGPDELPRLTVARPCCGSGTPPGTARSRSG
jgi:magnesium chelatase subunit I